MGATLPILVAYRTQQSGQLGRSVSEFYLANTVGSALACFATVDFFFAHWGLQATTWAAACCNIAVALAVGVFMLRAKHSGSAALSQIHQAAP
jgi:predicted membrane-bound spermidine synthase